MLSLPLVCVGLNHHTAPLAVRERFAFGPRRRREVLLGLRGTVDVATHGISEVALLSTCNRTELYGVPRESIAAATAPEILITLLASGAGETPELVRPHVYAHSGTTALAHLCKVAAGLDSMILGESEILGQVAEARREAGELGAGGPYLDAAFRIALQTGRRARVETGIGRRSSSIASEAVRMVAARIPSLGDASTAIVGSGQIARLVARILSDEGAGRVAVVGRSLEQASAACHRTPATPRAWQHLAATLRDADVVFGTTGAPHAVITRDLLAETRDRKARPLLIVDLAVPRDVDPAVTALPGVALIDLDTIQARVEANLRERAAEVPRVRTIVAEAIRAFETWRRGEELRPALAALRERAEAIRRREVERAQDHLHRRGLDSHQVLDTLSRDLVTRLLDAPSRRLRGETDVARQAALAEALQTLFDLDPRRAPEEAS